MCERVKVNQLGFAKNIDFRFISTAFYTLKVYACTSPAKQLGFALNSMSVLLCDFIISYKSIRKYAECQQK